MGYKSPSVGIGRHFCSWEKADETRSKADIDAMMSDAGGIAEIDFHDPDSRF